MTLQEHSANHDVSVSHVMTEREIGTVPRPSGSLTAQPQSLSIPTPKAISSSSSKTKDSDINRGQIHADTVLRKLEQSNNPTVFISDTSDTSPDTSTSK